MAVVKSGLFIDSKGSVGGVNLYKRKGVQCLRNKPVRSESYVSSPAQKFQQHVFTLVSEYSKSSASTIALIRGGWEAVVRGKGRSGYNNFLSEVLKKLSRNELGEKISQAQYEAAVDAFEENPGGWLHANVQLTKSKYPSAADVLTVTRSGSAKAQTLTVKTSLAYLNEWLSVNARQYGVVNAPNQVIVFVGGEVLESTGREWYLAAQPTITNDEVTAVFTGGLSADGAKADVAFAFYPAASGMYGKPLFPAVTQAARVVVGADGVVAQAALSDTPASYGPKKKQSKPREEVLIEGTDLEVTEK